MKCENCIHKSICIDGMNFKMLKECEECVEFKDQSKFIELPCKAGDTVYVDKKTLHDWYTFLELKNYVKAEVIGIKITKKQKLVNLKPITERTYNTRYHKFYPFSAFGKTVFLTKEEAEQALKGGADDE